MANAKSKNTWYGQATEIAITDVFSKRSLTNPFPEYIKENDWHIMIDDAACWINQFEKITNIHIYSCERIGNKTATENADLIINNTIHVEIKTVEGNGKATYAATSWNRLRDNYGIPIDSSKYLKNTGLGKLLVEYFGDIINLDNDAPMSIDAFAAFKEKNIIDKNFSDNWKKLDKKYRKEEVKKIVTFLINNPDIAKIMATDIATKSICHKETPDYYVVWSRKQKKITYLYDKTDIISLSSSYDIRTTKPGLGWYIGPFKLNLRWGNEFTNPAITIFI